MTATVAVSASVAASDRPFDYMIPPAMGGVKVGSRVWVPFGRSNRRCEGIVIAISDEPKEGLKPISALIDDEPLYDEQMLKTAAFLRERCFCTFFEAARIMLPAGFWFKTRTEYSLRPGLTEEEARKAAGNSKMALKMLSFLMSSGTSASSEELGEAAGSKAPAGHISKLVNAGVLVPHEIAKRGVGDRISRTVSLVSSADETVSALGKRAERYPVYVTAVKALAAGPMDIKALCYKTGISMASISLLERLGFFCVKAEETYRRPDMPSDVCEERRRLTFAQSCCADSLAQLFDDTKPRAALLFGVTGSGKTEVYIELIFHAISRGRGAILLVPEISLTSQFCKKFASVFGQRVAVLHSALSVGERCDEWKRISRGEADIVVGTRSAVFAPVRSLGTIIIDEEQEHTYRSEESPRYDAREVAKYRCVKSNALFVLGSATPSVESYYHALKGDYTLLRLNERYSGTQLPEAVIADMRDIPGGASGNIGNILADALKKNYASGGQSIVFINRRGASRLIACMKCGYIPECPHCTSALTYHAANGRLMCHYCGYSEPMPEICPVCGCDNMRHGAAGTQRIEEELRSILPEASIIRMDADTTSGKQSHEKLLREMYEGRADVLVGTQMVAKGLDFPRLSLVGVVDADMSLYSGDYRAAERTFSLLTQVTGRAGRRDERGSAVIQTLTPRNPVIMCAAAQDYDAFYEREIEMREALRLPPFADIVTFTVSGTDESAVVEAAMRLSMRIKALMNGEFSDIRSDILGPAPAAMLKVSGKYRYIVSFRCTASRSLRRLVAGVQTEFMSDRKNNGISAFAEINA